MARDEPSGKPGSERVSRDDIESKLREIRGEVDSTANAAKPALFTVVAVAAVAVVGVAYLVGRRRGRKKSTIVEIRRV
ncbi:MAG TPA: hypothetical protein VFV35_08205 [Acidimicrobiales bacterium]|nr:hypothetical protein [Acidimicrobiales bacterium]